MMLLQPRILIASAVSIVALCACSPSATSKATASSKGAAAATVNGIAITESQVALLTSQRAAQGQPVSPESRKDIIDNLALQLILSQEALKKGLDKTPAVTDQIELTKQSILAKAFVEDYVKSAPLTDDVLKAEYEKIKGQMSGNEYKARHILVEKEADASGIIAKLKKNPKLFAALAKEKSIDSGSKDKGGDLGWFAPHVMVPEFGAAVAKLEKGKFTEEPVKTQFGYHVILLDDSRTRTFPPFEQVKPAMEQQLQQQRVKKIIDDFKAKAKIEIAQAAAPAAPPAMESKPATPGK